MSTKTYVIGDIHGCYDKFRNLLLACLTHCGTQRATFICLGDYIDRGANSRDVVEFLMSVEARVRRPFICLRGNHEDLLSRVLDEPGQNESDWLRLGGQATLDSYGVDRASDIPKAHLTWLGNLRLFHRDDKRFYVHAGLVPGLSLDRQSRERLLWIRDEFLTSEQDHGLFIVHGHTRLKTGRPDLRSNRLNIDTGACFGGPLSAAVFCDALVEPLAFLTDDGEITTLRDDPDEADSA